MLKDRRTFLQISGAMVAAAAVPACGGSDSPGICSANGVTVGPASAFAVGSATLIANVPLYVCRDDKGLYALDACCTHQCCTVRFQDAQTGFQCPCHGSTFAFDGGNNTAPAPTPLRHFALCLDGDTVLVNPNSSVPSTTRVKV